MTKVHVIMEDWNDEATDAIVEISDEDAILYGIPLEKDDDD